MLKGGAGVTSQALRPTGGSGAGQRMGQPLSAVMVPTMVLSHEVRRAADAATARGVPRAHEPERQASAYSMVPAVARMGQAPHGDATMRGVVPPALRHASSRVAPEADGSFARASLLPAVLLRPALATPLPATESLVMRSEAASGGRKRGAHAPSAPRPKQACPMPAPVARRSPAPPAAIAPPLQIAGSDGAPSPVDTMVAQIMEWRGQFSDA